MTEEVKFAIGLVVVIVFCAALAIPWVGLPPWRRQ